MLTQGGVLGTHLHTQCGDTPGSYLAGSWDLAGGSKRPRWVGEGALWEGPPTLESIDWMRRPQDLGARGD